MGFLGGLFIGWLLWGPPRADGGGVEYGPWDYSEGFDGYDFYGQLPGWNPVAPDSKPSVASAEDTNTSLPH